MEKEIKDLEKDYAAFEKKYKLPTFKELNENFEIEKIDRESKTLLRTIRKVIIEKLVNSLGFVELLLNPVNAPRMYYSYLKTLTQEDKNELDKVYSVLSNVVLSAIELEIDYDEKEEAEMIKRIYKDWESVKPAFRKILGNMKKPEVSEVRKEKTYFG